MFSYFSDSFKKIFTACSNAFGAIFSRSMIDEHALQEIEQLLLSADTGVSSTKKIIDQLRNLVASRSITNGDDLKKEFKKLLISQLESTPFTNHTHKKVFLLLGINGSGKTTFASKLAYKFLQEKKKILLVAADTFRAAAQEQLIEWANRLNIDIINGQQGDDPSTVVYKGCEKFKSNQYDIMIIDTAGRLQNKINLMNELIKLKKIISKFFESESIETLITIDSMLGQNSLDQAKVFKEATQVTGVVLTKMDGTGKGGIVFGITNQLSLPILFISFGENPDQLLSFNAQEYVQNLLETNSY